MIALVSVVAISFNIQNLKFLKCLEDFGALRWHIISIDITLPTINNIEIHSTLNIQNSKFLKCSVCFGG